MAVDTRDKRSSAIAMSMPFRGMLPLPDGSINAGDRLHLALLYRGISASAVVVGAKFATCILRLKHLADCELQLTRLNTSLKLELTHLADLELDPYE